jgi:arylsulfatase A-like enzyme
MFPRLLSAIAACSLHATAAEKPNILWITSEDNAAHWLGCYGNGQASTPRLDKLAAGGILFRHAYSNAPVCAVARSTILTGVHAPSQGTQHMRSRHPIPAEIKPHVAYLRQQGYHCTNASKTDYNFKGNDNAIWDECSAKAHYRSRSQGQPFFAIFNLTETHESSLFGGRNRSGNTRLKPSEIQLPACLPDLPEVRNDFAAYHDNMTRLDQRVGAILDELEQAGLADDTIVFYYSDHGGPTPRGKRYLEDTGTHVPMLVRVPGKWHSLTPFKPGEAVDEPVSFVDLAFTATSASPSATEQLHSALKSEDPVKRHWALLGMRVRGKADGVPPLLDDQHSVNRVLAAEALHAAGQTEAAAKALLAELDRNIGEYPTVHLLNAITRLGVSNQVPDEWLRKAMGKGSGNEYLKRFARQIRNERN